jgi:DNA ligase-1
MSTLIQSPMLATKLPSIKSVNYPVLCTPKLDGIRCLVINGNAVSRKFKPIPNNYIREQLKDLPDNLDGELITYTNGIRDNFNIVSSKVMSEDGEPEFSYEVFDYVSENLTKQYDCRMSELWLLKLPNFINKLIPITIQCEEELLSYEEKCLNEGYEGIMLRIPEGPYKCGRSTPKEAYLLKLKRFEDSEAIIIGFEERMHNANEQTKDAFGYTERSSHKDNMIPMNTLGALQVKDIKTNKEFKIGTGFDDAMRQLIWSSKDKYINQIVVYKHQPSGSDELPRFPVFKGIRNKIDM